MRQFQQVVDRLGVLQIDSVNVLARAHLHAGVLPDRRLRPGAARPGVGRGAAPARRDVGAQASFVPPETFRLLGWRQRAYLDQAWGAIAEVPLKHSPLVDEIRAIIAERGPVTARQVQEDFEADHPTTRGEWGWNWTVAKRVLEFLFFTGEVTSAGRNGAFERRYDLTSRVLPAARPGRCRSRRDEDAVRALTEIGARAHGIGTLRSFADYFRIKEARVAPAIADLVEEGVLQRGRRSTAGTRGRCGGTGTPTCPVGPPAARCSTRSTRWCSSADALEALFGLRYRIEIYVPEPQAGLGLLRPAVPARGVAAGAGGPQGRPSGGGPAGARRAPGDRARRRRTPTWWSRWPPSCASSPGGSAWRTSWSATGTGCCAVTSRRPGARRPVGMTHETRPRDFALVALGGVLWGTGGLAGRRSPTPPACRR